MSTPNPAGPTIRARLAQASAGLGSCRSRLANFVLPPVCLSCHKPLIGYDTLCATCWRNVEFIRPPVCDRLGTPLAHDIGVITISAAATADPPVYDRARAVAHFTGTARALIHALKYADRHDGRRLLGRWLSTAGAEILDDAHLLVPVPLHRLRLFTRRFNQAAILAQELARQRQMAWDPAVLIRVKRTAQQVGLTRDQRMRNVAAAFRVPERALARVETRNIVLVDDVITTGATVNACARALKSAGAARVDVLAIALATGDHVGERIS